MYHFRRLNGEDSLLRLPFHLYHYLIPVSPTHQEHDFARRNEQRLPEFIIPNLN